MIDKNTELLAVSLKQAGASNAVISEKLGLSVSGVKYCLRRHQGIRKGENTAKMLQVAKSVMLNDKALVEQIKLQTANAIMTDLALVARLQDMTVDLIEQVEFDEKMTLAAKCRAIQSLATTAATTASIMRKTLNLDNAEMDSTMPMLEIRRMTNDEVLEIQQQANHIEKM